MNLEMNYLKERVMESVKDIANHDSESNKIKNLEYLDTTIVNMCDLLKLISHEQATELRKPIIEEIKKDNDFRLK